MWMVFFLFSSIRSFSHTRIRARRPPSTKLSESICLSILIRQCCNKTASHSETYSSCCWVIPFVWGLCSAAWLRGSERAKLANSLEDLYVWVRLVISAFQRTHFCALGTVCRCIFSALQVCSVFTGSTWARASSICGWRKSENSSLRDPRAQKLVGCVKNESDWHILQQALHIDWDFIAWSVQTRAAETFSTIWDIQTICLMLKTIDKSHWLISLTSSTWLLLCCWCYHWHI